MYKCILFETNVKFTILNFNNIKQCLQFKIIGYSLDSRDYIKWNIYTFKNDFVTPRYYLNEMQTKMWIKMVKKRTVMVNHSI